MTALITTAVGSYAKPDYLTKARSEFSSGKIRPRRARQAREAGDGVLDPRPGEGRAGRPRPRRDGARRHGRLLLRRGRRQPDQGDEARRPRPLLRQPLLPQADHLRQTRVARADDRRHVEVRAGPDRPAREGHAHRRLHDGGVVVRRALPVAARRGARHGEGDPPRGRGAGEGRAATTSRSTSRRSTRARRRTSTWPSSPCTRRWTASTRSSTRTSATARWRRSTRRCCACP